MDELHEDILTKILLRVPASSLARLKWMNKRWHALISHPTFIDSHLEHTREDPASRMILKIDNDYYPGKPVKFACVDPEKISRENRVHVPTGLPIARAFIAGTCDGLVCLDLTVGDKSCGTRRGIICLWNPATRELRELPNLQNPCWPASKVGMGYDCVADDYKVVALANRRTATARGMTPVHIWARKTSTWKRVSNTPEIDSVCGSSFYLKGAVHWLARRETGRHAVFSHSILSFGFAKEEFKELPMPNNVPNWDWPTLGILGGCLCAYTGLLLTSREHVEAWMMTEYGVETSWAKLFKISTETIQEGRSMRLLTVRDGKILLVCDSKPRPFVYDLKEKKLCGFRDVGRWSGSGFRVYEESLVSP